MKFFKFIALLRAVAAYMVVYDHLFCIFAETFYNKTFFPAGVVRAYVTEPLGIIQDFGWFGVVLFFLISGFIITHVSMRETRREFAVRRLLRIYPPLIASIIVAAAVAYLFGGEISSIKEYLISFSLFNYFIHPQIITQGVAWTLIIEVLFYILTFIFIKMLRTRPSTAVLLQIIIISAIYSVCRYLGPGFFLFSATSAFIPYLILGQLIYLIYSEKLPAINFLILTTLTYLCIIAGIKIIHTGFYPANNSYIISALYAYGVFCIALALNSKIKIGRLTLFTSKISYSLYLYHGIVGVGVLRAFSAYTDSQLVIIPAVIVSFAVSYLSYRFIEEPGINMAKRLVRI